MEKIKLYTEEQVRQAMQKAMIPSIYRQDLWGQLTPIELPSDKEIVENSTNNPYESYECGYIDGVNLVLNKIKQQSDGK